MDNRIEIGEVLKISGNALKLKLYIIISTATHLNAVKQNVSAHRAYLKNLEKRNILFAAGPLLTDDGQHFVGNGLWICRAASVEEAITFAQGDPMHSSGARTFTVRPWLLNYGKMTIQVTLSEPQRALV
ncbi:MAG: YciI family protein [Cyanobacteria bacterium P01_H01_bin.21]